MKFVVLLDNPIFLSLSFYEDPQNPKLYLHLNGGDERSGSSALLALSDLKSVKQHPNGTKSLEQPQYLAEAGLIRIDQASDIGKILKYFSEIGYLNAGHREVLLPLLHQIKDAEIEVLTKEWDELRVSSEATTSESDYESLPSSPRRAISPEDDANEAFSAAKQGNAKLLEVLLGDGVTAEDIAVLEKGRLRLDNQSDARFAREYQALSYSYLEKIIDRYLEKEAAKKSFNVEDLRKDLTQGLYDAKEVIIGAKISYPYRPYLLGIDLTSSEAFAGWLNGLYERHRQDMDSDLSKLDFSLPLKLVKLKAEVVSRQETAIKGFQDLNNLRAKNAEKFGNKNAHVNHKCYWHAENIAQLWHKPSHTLPELYRYTSESEKSKLTQHLCEVKVPLDITDQNGNTLLHWTLYHGHTWLAIELLKRGIDETALNHTGQTAAEFAGKAAETVEELKKIAKGESKVQNIPFLKCYREISKEYEEKLLSKETWLSSPILSLLGKFRGLDELEIIKRRAVKAELDGLYQQALLTGNTTPLYQAINQRCIPENKLNPSSFYQLLIQLAQEALMNPELLGPLRFMYGWEVAERGDSVRDSQLREQAARIRTLMQENATAEQRIAELTAEKRDLAAQNRDLIVQNSDLIIQKDTLEKGQVQQELTMTELRQNARLWETRYTTLESGHAKLELENIGLKSQCYALTARFDSLAEMVMQRLDQQDKKQEALSLSLPAPRAQFFSPTSSASSSSVTSATSSPVMTTVGTVSSATSPLMTDLLLESQNSVFPDMSPPSYTLAASSSSPSSMP